MKKITLILLAILLTSLSACKKDPIENPDPTPGSNDPASLIGTWNPTSQAYFKVMLYYQDGTFCDSLYSDYTDQNGFVFTSSTQVETPWEITATYSLSSDSISFNLMGIITRSYKLLDFTNSHLAFERMDIGEYTTANDNGGTDTLVGYEYDHWDLKKL